MELCLSEISQTLHDNSLFIVTMTLINLQGHRRAWRSIESCIFQFDFKANMNFLFWSPDISDDSDVQVLLSVALVLGPRMPWCSCAMIVQSYSSLSLCWWVCCFPVISAHIILWLYFSVIIVPCHLWVLSLMHPCLPLKRSCTQTSSHASLRLLSGHQLHLLKWREVLQAHLLKPLTTAAWTAWWWVSSGYVSVGMNVS